jgi:hypothetical protein
LKFLLDIEGQSRPDMSNAPIDVANQGWKRLVINDGQVDRRAYTLCVLERLQDSLRRRDIYVSPSERWSDPRAKLLQGSTWEKAKPQVCKTLGRCNIADDELDALSKALEEAYRRTAHNLPSNAAVAIDPVDGRDTLRVSGLDKLEEPASLLQLRDDVKSLLPRVDLPEVLLEINQQTGFLEEFTHISEGNARVQDLSTSLVRRLSCGSV